MINTTISFKSSNGKHQIDHTFNLEHNLDEHNLSIDAILMEWSFRTKDLGIKSFCKYVESKSGFICKPKNLETIPGETKKKVQKKCYNCKHSGNPFKIAGKTHMHCEHEKYTEADFLSGKISPWDTLMEFWNTCEDHEPKNQKI